MMRDLIDSLTAVQPDGVELDDDRYIDWSSRLSDGTYLFEVGDGGGDSIQAGLSPADMLRLHAALTATLIRDTQEG